MPHLISFTRRTALVSSFPHYLAGHAHFSSINIHTVPTSACSYIYIQLLLYIFQSRKRIYNPVYLREWHTSILFHIELFIYELVIGILHCNISLHKLSSKNKIYYDYYYCKTLHNHILKFRFTNTAYGCITKDHNMYINNYFFKSNNCYLIKCPLWCLQVYAVIYWHPYVNNCL